MEKHFHEFMYEKPLFYVIFHIFKINVRIRMKKNKYFGATNIHGYFLVHKRFSVIFSVDLFVNFSFQWTQKCNSFKWFVNISVEMQLFVFQLNSVSCKLNCTKIHSKMANFFNKITWTCFRVHLPVNFSYVCKTIYIFCLFFNMNADVMFYSNSKNLQFIIWIWIQFHLFMRKTHESAKLRRKCI